MWCCNNHISPSNSFVFSNSHTHCLTLLPYGWFQWELALWLSTCKSFVLRPLLLLLLSASSALSLLPSAFSLLPSFHNRGMCFLQTSLSHYSRQTHFSVSVKLSEAYLKHLHVCLCTICSVHRKRKSWIPWGWSYRWLWAVMQVLGTEPEFSGRAVSPFNHEDISLAVWQASWFRSLNLDFHHIFMPQTQHFQYISTTCFPGPFKSIPAFFPSFTS